MKKLIYILMFIGMFQLVSAVTLNSGIVLNTSVSNSSMTFSISIEVDKVTITDTNITLEGVSCSNGVTVTQVVWNTPNTNRDSADTYCVSTVLTGGGGTNPGCRLRTQACSDSYPCCEGTECVEGICWTPLGGRCYDSDYCKMPQMCIDGYCALESNETIEEEKEKDIITEFVEDVVDFVKDILGIEELDELDEEGNVIEKEESEDGSDNNTILFFIVISVIGIIYYRKKEKEKRY